MISGRSLATAFAVAVGCLPGCSVEDGSRDLERSEAGLSVSVGPTEFARFGHTTTLLPSGEILVAGGTGNLVAELFDPATGTWRRTGYMGAARNGHSATLLSSGRVLVAGGYYLTTRGSVGISSAELYDPATGAWSPTGSLSQPFGHQAILLPSGMVLAVGVTHAEVYDPATGSWTPTGSPSSSLGRSSLSLLSSAKLALRHRARRMIGAQPGPRLALHDQRVEWFQT